MKNINVGDVVYINVEGSVKKDIVVDIDTVMGDIKRYITKNETWYIEEEEIFTTEEQAILKVKNIIRGVLCDSDNKVITTTLKEFTERTLEMNILMNQVRTNSIELYEKIKDKAVYFYCFSEDIMNSERNKYQLRSKYDLFTDGNWKYYNELVELADEVQKNFQFMDNGSIYQNKNI